MVNRTEGLPAGRPQVFVDVKSCARCGQEHTLTLFEPLDRPMAPEDANGLVWNYWALCSRTKQPILMRVTEVEENKSPL